VKCVDRMGNVRSKKTVSATANVCTSLISVGTKNINLGDCAIGSWKV